MTSFLEKLRAKNAGTVPNPNVGDAPDKPADASIVHYVRTKPNAIGAEAEAAPDSGVPDAGDSVGKEEAPTQQATPKPAGFLFRIKGSAPAPVPSPLSDSSPSLLDADGALGSGDGDGESVGTDSPDSSGHGDAPVSSTALVETAPDSGAAPSDPTELFRARLAALDELCQTESGITALMHSTVKAHVRGIMEDLRENPEMRGLILDDDMHNIMLFIQSSAEQQENKVVKVATKRIAKEKNKQMSSAFDDAFSALDNVPTLESLGNQSTDSIQTKVR